MGVAEQVVNRVQFGAGQVRVVHPGDAHADLETQRGVVPEHPDQLKQLLAQHHEGDFVAPDQHPGREVRHQGSHPVGDVVEPATEGRECVAVELDDAVLTLKTRGVTGTVSGTPHAVTHSDDRTVVRAGGQHLVEVGVQRRPGELWIGLGGLVGVVVEVAHRMSPFRSSSAGAAKAANSLSATCLSRLAPIGPHCTSFSRSLKMASISMSGRGGQPGT